MVIVFHKMASLEEAMTIVEKEMGGIEPLGVEYVDIMDACGRVLAEDVYAKVDYPPFDRSIVDGYAVDAKDTYGASEAEPTKLMVVGRSEVGSLPSIEVRNGCAVEISTGAPIPKGANAVVMVEHTKREGDYVLVYKSVLPGENISQAGSDISLGDPIFKKGKLLTAIDIAVLASTGIDRVKVYRKPRIAIFSTGNELIPPGLSLDPGKIYDVNSYAIASLLREMGVEAEFLGIIPDDLDTMVDRINFALERYDVVITSGSTSAGFGDMIYRVFDRFGAVVVHGIKLRPGKPTVFAVSGKKLLIGLPGFPLSAMVVLTKVVKPLIAKMCGTSIPEVSTTIKARLAYKLEAGRGMREFIPVQVVQTEAGYVAYPITLGSGSASALMLSDGLVEVSEDRMYLEENEEVCVTLFSAKPSIPSIQVMGSHCPGVNILLKVAGITDARVVNVGSMGGWIAIKNGYADVCGTHLLDEETGTYNLHIPSIVGVEDSVEIYRGYGRRIGIVVKKGNPLNINGIEDLLRSDVVIVNRPRGSGARVLLDIALKKMGIDNPEDRIRGYVYEVKTHTAVASAIAQGRADVGIAIEYVAELYKLDFIPLGEEIFDFAVRKDRLSKQSVKRFLEALSSDAFRSSLLALKGYRVLPDTGKKVYG